MENYCHLVTYSACWYQWRKTSVCTECLRSHHTPA